MGNMMNGATPALLTSRAVNDLRFAHNFVVESPADKTFLSSKTSGSAYVFPLYVFTSEERNLLQSGTTKHHNLARHNVDQLSQRLNIGFVEEGLGDLRKTFGPDSVFHYIYAILSSPIYRERYAELLKIDFPRVPLTSDTELFRELCSSGSELVGLHLLKNVDAPRDWMLITDGSTLYEIAEVAAGFPKYDDGKVFINKTAWFDGVAEEVWNFHIGGYQVCHKWLKDRKGRTLSAEDVAHYGKITVALRETIRLMAEIDEVIEQHGGFPLPGSVPESIEK
jgi:predicted helicase